MEVEIKLNVRPAIVGGPVMFFTKVAMVPQLANLPLGPVRKIEIRDVYFDTEDGALSKAGAGLRLRVENGMPYVTLKISKHQDGALVQREEFQEPLTQERLDWVLSHVREQVGDGPFPFTDFAGMDRCGPLVRTLEVWTARMSRTVGAIADLSMDMVEYPGLATNPYFEIEVESLKGEAYENFLRRVETELYALAAGDLAPAMVSKLERGLRMKEKARV